MRKFTFIVLFNKRQLLFRRKYNKFISKNKQKAIFLLKNIAFVVVCDIYSLQRDVAGVLFLPEILSCGFLGFGGESYDGCHCAACHEEERQVHDTHYHLEWNHSGYYYHGKIEVVVVFATVGSQQVAGALLAIIAIGEHGGESKEEYNNH